MNILIPSKRLLPAGTVLVALSLFLGTIGSVNAQQVQSDYEIQHNFKEKVKTITDKLNDAGTITEAELIADQIDSLQYNYSAYEKLINKAIYPDTFSERIDQLESRVGTTKQRLVTIERQDKELQTLSARLSSYGTKLNQLNNRADSLQLAMRKTERSEQQLSSQVQDYRSSLQQRDELLLSFIDSVAISYRELNIGRLSEVQSEKNIISTDDGPLALIRTIPSENIELLESNSKLAVEDYLRMKAVEREFHRMWTKVGDKITRIYSDNPSRVRSEIEQNATEWQRMLDKRMWSALQQSFDQAGINIEEFQDSKTFIRALNTYVEQGIVRSKEENGSQAYSHYSNFIDYWNNRVKRQWTDHLIESRLLTSTQISDIDEKVNHWASIAEPESHLFAYLFGASVLALVILGVVLFREKSNTSTSEPKQKVKTS